VKLDAHAAQGARPLDGQLAAYKLAPLPAEASIPRAASRGQTPSSPGFQPTEKSS